MNKLVNNKLKEAEAVFFLLNDDYNNINNKEL